MGSKKKTSPMADAQEAVVKIKPLAIAMAQITIIGDSPLICHAWSKRDKQKLLDRQMKKAAQKTVKDPQQDFVDSLYMTSDKKYGFPAMAFKLAACDAWRAADMPNKVNLLGGFHVVPDDGELVVVHGNPAPREDPVRLAGPRASADLRYRGQFNKWHVNLRIRYNTAMLSLEQIVNLFNISGFSVGVGEWRPQKGGSNGMFHVGNL